MRAIGGACLGKARVAFDQEVIPVGKADAALRQGWQIAGGILDIDRDKGSGRRGRHGGRPARQGRQLVPGQLRQGPCQLRRTGDGGDARQFRLQGCEAAPFDAAFIHQAGIKVTQLALFGIARRRCGSFQDGAVALGIEIIQPRKFDPPAAVGGYWRIAQPRAVDIAKEVVPGRDRPVHRFQVDAAGAHSLGIGDRGAHWSAEGRAGQCAASKFAPCRKHLKSPR